jgi:MFS family permease
MPYSMVVFPLVGGPKVTLTTDQVCTLIIALVNNLPALLVVRFFQGVGASTFSTMVLYSIR